MPPTRALKRVTPWFTTLLTTTVALGAFTGPAAAQPDTPALARTVAAAPPARPFEALSRSILIGRDRILAMPARDSVVSAARSQLGLRYRLGALAPGRAFDCSGLVKWVLGLFDIDVPRTAAQQAQQGMALPRDPSVLLPGDLLYFGKGRRITHIGIYVGDGLYVHASDARKGIIESPVPAISSTWWRGARRVIPAPLDNPELWFEGITPTTTSAFPVIRIL